MVLYVLLVLFEEDILLAVKHLNQVYEMIQMWKLNRLYDFKQQIPEIDNTNFFFCYVLFF